MAYFADLFISLLIGFLSAGILVAIFKRTYIGFWAFLGGIAPDWPRIFLTPLGSTNLEGLLWATHTIGLFIFPILLVLVDIPLMEIGFVRYLKPFNSVLPEQIRSIIHTETMLEKLQKYKVLPRPARLKYVYLAAVFAGLLHVAINFFIGQL